MSTAPADVERKLRQLDDEVQAIYEMLARIDGTQRRHDNRFAEIGADVTDLRSQVSGLREDLTALDTKVTGLDTKVTGLDTKLDRVIDLLEQ